MKMNQKFRMATLGAAVLMLAGAASAQTFDNTYVHGNSCTGGGVTQSPWGVYNSSFSSAANVTCPIANAWPTGSPTQQRWVQVTVYNRNPTAGAFTCNAYGLNDAGVLVWSPAAVSFPAGSAGSSPVQTTLGVPPISAVNFSVSCTIPKAVGSGNVYSYVTAIAVKVGS